MKTVTASTKRFMILMMALMITASVSAQQHMTFDGVPINGKVETFTKRLIAANHNYKYVRNQGGNSFLKGKVQILDDMEADFVIPNCNDGKFVYAVTISSFKNFGNYNKIKNLLINKYPSAVCRETFYKYDVIESNQDFKKCYLTIPSLGVITITEGLGMDETEELTIVFEDEINSKKYNPSRYSRESPIVKTLSLKPYVNCVDNAVLYEKENKEIEITIVNGGKKNKILPQSMDGINLKKLIQGNASQNDKSTIINAYIYSVVSENSPENTVIVTQTRMERIQHNYTEYQAQKLQEQQHKQKIEMIQAGILMYLLKGMFSKTNEKDIPPTGNDKILNPDKYTDYYYGR